MKKQHLLIAWAGMFILCAGLGFIPRGTGFREYLLAGIGVLFFLPPAALLYLADRDADRNLILLVRNLSAASLGLTLALITLSVLLFAAPVALGNILYAMLVILSAPMMCCRYWVLSLFGWACLLFTCVNLMKKRR